MCFCLNESPLFINQFCGKMQSIIVKVTLIGYSIKQQVPNFATRLHKHRYSHVFKFNDRLKDTGSIIYMFPTTNLGARLIKITSSITHKIYPLLHM